MKYHATRLLVLGPVCLLLAGLLGLLISRSAARQTVAEGAASPQHTEGSSENYMLINGIFASGSGGTPQQSTNYRLDSTLGEPALAAQVTLSSSNYKLRPGFLASFDPGARLYLPLLRSPVGCNALEPSDAIYATALQRTTYEAMLCTGTDLDYYFFVANGPGQVQLTLNLPPALRGHTSFWLFNNSNATLGGTATVTGSSHTINHTISSAGTYKIGIYTDGAFDTANPYSLSLQYP